MTRSKITIRNKTYELEPNGITNPYTKEHIQFLASSNEKKISFIWTVGPGGKMPFKHMHRNQSETFHVLSGTCKMLLENQSVNICADEVLTIQPGQTHQPMNASSTDKLIVLVTVKPGLNFRIAIETVFGLATENRCTNDGKPYFWHLIAIHYGYPYDYIPSIPMWLQDLVCNLLGPLLLLCGIKPCYKRFSCKCKY